MDEKVTRLPQRTTRTTQHKIVASSEDLNKLILAGQEVIDCFQAITGEMLAFWQSRLKAGLATGGRLLEATSADSALEAQLDYARGAIHAYLDQSARITGLLMRALDAGCLVEPVDARSSDQTRASAA